VNDLKKMIDIIADATLCDQWKIWVMNDMEERKRFPPFIRAFYNLTCQNDDDPSIFNPTLNAALNEACSYMSSKKHRDLELGRKNNLTINQMMESGVPKDSSSHKQKWMINEAKKECDKYTEATTIHEIVNTTDNFNTDVSWSVLSLFYHPSICKVPETTEGETFSFWPTCAPKVNNRSVEYGELYNEEPPGFVQSFVDNSKLSWESQSVKVLPYCVTVNTEASEVKLGPVIGTTNMSTQQASDEQASVDESDMFAGDLRATQIMFKDVEKIYQALTGLSLESQEVFARSHEIVDHEKAFLGLKKCLQILMNTTEFNGLKTAQDWCNLYVKLWHDGVGGVELGDFPFHPGSLTDLVHKTRMLFLSKHSLRFAFLEGQKRSTAATYALTGFVPKVKFDFHGDHDPASCIIGGYNNFFNKPNNYNDEPDLIESDDKCLRTFENGARTVNVNVYQFKTNEGILDVEVIRCCREYSKLLVQEGNREQIRTWKNIVENLTMENSIKNALSGRNNTDSWNVSEKINPFVQSFRILFFQLMFKNENTSVCLKEDCREVGPLMKLLEKDSKKTEFSEVCLFNAKKKLKTKIYGSYLDFRNVPAPKMVHSLCTIFGCIGIGNEKGIALINNISSLQGKRTSFFGYKKGFTFFKTEPDYVVKVRNQIH
jgi:hypothetical protein